jgi:hypothetical protein
MWISAAEYKRMESALAAALRRAETAETRLADERKRLDDIVASERQSKDWLTLQMASRLVQKAGQYGLGHVPGETSEPPPHPKGYLREPNEVDRIRLAAYIKWATEAGVANPKEEAQQRWDAEMRGETVTYTDGEQ